MTADVRATRSASLSIASQLGAKVLHLGLNVVSTIAIVRYLAPEAYGTYVLVLTVTTLAGVLADFGLPKLAVREMVRPGADPDAVAGTIIWVRLALAVAAAVGVQAVLLLFQQPPAAHVAAAVASLVVFAEAVFGVLVVVFQIHLAQHYEAALRVLAEALETALVLLLIAQGASLPWLFLPPVLGLVVALLLASVFSRGRFHLRPRMSRAYLRPVLREAVSVGPALLVGVLYLKLDSLLVAGLRTPEELGLYGAAYQPIEYLFLGTAVVMNVVFPLLATAWTAAQRDRFLTLYRRGTELLVAVTVVVPAVAVVTAPALVEVAFGSAYADAAAPLRVLSLAIVLMTVNAWQSLVLLSGGHQVVTLVYNLVALVIATVLCVALLPLVGITGAAWATLGTACFVLAASTTAVRRLMQATLDLGRLARVLAAGALAAAAAALLTGLGAPWYAAIPAALVVYGGALAAIGVHRSVREVLA